MNSFFEWFSPSFSDIAVLVGFRQQHWDVEDVLGIRYIVYIMSYLISCVYSFAMWGPLVLTWFKNPSNYSYKYHKPYLLEL